MVETPGLSATDLESDGAGEDPETTAAIGAALADGPRPTRKRVVIEREENLPPRASSMRPEAPPAILGTPIQSGDGSGDVAFDADYNFPLFPRAVNDPNGIEDPRDRWPDIIIVHLETKKGEILGEIPAKGVTAEDIRRRFDKGLGRGYYLIARDKKGRLIANGEEYVSFDRRIPDAPPALPATSPEVMVILNSLRDTVHRLETDLRVERAKSESKSTGTDPAIVALLQAQQSTTNEIIKSLASMGQRAAPTAGVNDQLLVALVNGQSELVKTLASKNGSSGGENGSMANALALTTQIVELAGKMNPGATPENPLIAGAKVLVDGLGNVAAMIAAGRKPAEAVAEVRSTLMGQAVPSPAAGAPPLIFVPAGSRPVAPPSQPVSPPPPPGFGESPSAKLFADAPGNGNGRRRGRAGPRAEGGDSPAAPTPAPDDPLAALDAVIADESKTAQDVASIFLDLANRKIIPKLIVVKLLTTTPEAYPAWCERLGKPEWGTPERLPKLVEALAHVREAMAQSRGGAA